MRDAQLRNDSDISDAHDALYAALKYHSYQAEAYAEHGVDHADNSGENARNVASHTRYAAQCHAALVALVGEAFAADALKEARRLATLRVHGD